MLKKKLSLYISITVLAVIIYVVLYGPIVATGEKIGIKNVVYILYEPVEFLRCNSKPIYLLTEKLYAWSGGKIDSSERYFFKTKRRSFDISDSTICYGAIDMVVDCIYIDNKKCGVEIWKYKGQETKTKFYFQDEIITRLIVFWGNGEILCDLYFKDGKIIDGTYEWKTGEHQIAKCLFKNGHPYNGKAIFRNNGRLGNDLRYSEFAYYMYNPEFNTAKNAMNLHIICIILNLIQPKMQLLHLKMVN